MEAELGAGASVEDLKNYVALYNESLEYYNSLYDAVTPSQEEIDAAFVVLDPRQEKDYDRGLCYFLEHIPVESVYPMHYWGQPDIIETFLKEHPEYKEKIQKTE